MWGTLRVVTARELVVLSGSFTSHSKSARRLRHFTWSCEPREIHNLQCWRARKKSPHAYPRAPGIEPGAAAWQAHTLPLALLQPFIVRLITFLDGVWMLDLSVLHCYRNLRLMLMMASLIDCGKWASRWLGLIWWNVRPMHDWQTPPQSVHLRILIWSPSLRIF